MSGPITRKPFNRGFFFKIMKLKVGYSYVHNGLHSQPMEGWERFTVTSKHNGTFHLISPEGKTTYTGHEDQPSYNIAKSSLIKEYYSKIAKDISYK